MLCLVFLLHGNDVGDFGNYYYGSLFLKEGRFTLDVYEPFRFNQMVAEKIHDPFFLNYTPVPVFTALVYLPFTFLDFYTAKFTWNIFTALLFCISLYRLARFYRLKPGIVLLYALALYIPVKTNLFLGQTYLLLFFLVAEGLLAYEKKKWIAMGLFWALAILLKVFPVFIFFFLVKEKNYKAAGVLLVCCLLLTVSSMLFISPSVWWHYASEILPRTFAGDINDPFSINYQSMDVLFRQVLLYDAHLNPDPLIHAPFIFSILSVTSKFFLVFLYFSFSVKTKKDHLATFSFTVLLGMLISGYGSLYGYILLLFPLLAFTRKANYLLHISFLGLCFVISFPVAYMYQLPVAIAFPKVYIMLAFYILVWVRFKKIRLRPVVILSALLLPAILVSFFTKKYNPDPMADAQPPSLLAYDFTIDGNNLCIFYWNREGAVKKIIPLGYEVKKYTEKQGPEYRKSILVNENTWYYLSDDNRGPGLYTVRYKEGWAE